MFARTRDEGFGPEVKRRIMLAPTPSPPATTTLYLKAQKVRTLIMLDFVRAFDAWT